MLLKIAVVLVALFAFAYVVADYVVPGRGLARYYSAMQYGTE